MAFLSLVLPYSFILVCIGLGLVRVGWLNIAKSDAKKEQEQFEQQCWQDSKDEWMFKSGRRNGRLQFEYLSALAGDGT